MPILAAFMVPHPPMIVPQVGRGSEKQVEKTIRAYEQVAREIAQLKPETILISSPHATMYLDYFHISPGREATGSFRNFGAGQIRFRESYDQELVGKIRSLAQNRGFPAGTMGEREKWLDHGTMVPLYFIRQQYTDFRLVRIGLSGMPLTRHYELGQIIAEAVRETGRRAVYVASGDLSHKLQTYGPYGFAPEGPQYDERIMDVCSRAAFGELFDFDESFCEKAAECGHRSFVIMAGVLDGMDVKAAQLSHEDVTGVGYGICTFYPRGSQDPQRTQEDRAEREDLAGSRDSTDSSDGGNDLADPGRHFLAQYLARQQALLKEQREKSDAYVRLARKSLESYIRERRVIPLPEDDGDDGELPAEMKQEKAGVFVSIHEHGKLRGCIGTISPVTNCIASEIIRNAISASTQDPRFDPITEDELDWLEIHVDVLGKAEPIDSPDQLDVKRYGVIVSRGMKRGLLLPDLDGVDTVAQQIDIARQKAGIGPKEAVKLERFEVVRHQ